VTTRARRVCQSRAVEFTEVVRQRRMLRRYDPERKVPDEILTRLLGLVSFAPTAGFAQGWDFVVLRDHQARADFWSISTEADRKAPTSPDASSPGAEGTDDPRDAWLRGMRTAPVLVLCLADRNRYLERYALPDKGWTDRDAERWTVPYWDVDTGMAALLILLGAENAGLGGCFFGVQPSSQEGLRARFDIPADRRFVAALTLGYAPEKADSREPRARSPHRPRRRPVREYAHDGRFGSAWPTQNNDQEA
jgi:nitroreductase